MHQIVGTKIIIFGTGELYQRRKHLILSTVEIVAFIDNNPKLEGTELDGVMIYLPEKIANLKYDKIVLASMAHHEMKMQLINMGIAPDKIMHWEEYIGEINRGNIEKITSDLIPNNNKKSFLIIVPIINYAGGFLTAFYAGKLMRDLGYYVVIVSPLADNKVVELITQQGIDVWLCPSVLYFSNTELEWAEKFDYVLCNSLHTIVCATKINAGKRLLFWIHENPEQYGNILEQYDGFYDYGKLKNINVYAVSKRCKSNVVEYLNMDDLQVGILPFGIPDSKRGMRTVESETNKKIIFSVIGGISRRKNQIFIVKAFKSLPQEYKEQIECKLIGQNSQKAYRKELEAELADTDFVKLCGEKTQKEIRKMLSHIDVIACVSKEESMSMTIVEGLMNGCICLTNNNTGIADFLTDGENGFVYKADDQESLNLVLKKIISRFKDLDNIRKMGRETYEKVFSMKAFKERLMKIYGM